MKFIPLLLSLLIFTTIQSQIITTVAGNGTIGYSGDGGPAINAELGDMYYTYPAFDNAGNMYIAQDANNTIRKIDAAGTITTIAGTNGVIGYSGDGGPAANALLYHPASIAIDNANNIYFGDRNGSIIRKIDPSGIITTVSGQYTLNCGAGDGGPLALAQFGAISAITIDQFDNLYISDFECNTIRKVNSAGIITTIAGNGMWGYSGDGGPATQAQMAYPGKVAIDNAGNVYVPDAQNQRIRKISTAGIITTFAGNGTYGYSGDGGPALSANVGFPGSIVIDDTGNFYFSNDDNFIRKIDLSGTITTFAGNGTYGYSGDGGPAIMASIALTTGRISINNNNIYFVNYLQGNVIRKVSNCINASITQQPDTVTLCNSGNAIFSITATNTTGYHWQLNTAAGWINLSDNSTYAGTTSSTLSITGATSGMNKYQYRCWAASGCGTIFSTTALLVVNAITTPSISIVTSVNNICKGASVNLSATVVNGGTAPSYQWKKNGINVGTNNNSYSDNGLANGDIIACRLVSNANCLTGTTAISNSIVMSVAADVTPVIAISASNNDICFGTPVTFSSSITNGGSNPEYTWFKNNVNLFTNSPTYTDNSVNNGDVISCEIHSSLSCVTSQVVSSLPLTMTVNPLRNLSVSITASAIAVCKNIPVLFTAFPVNGGTVPKYQWKKNGLPVGSNSNNYSDSNLVNGDLIACTLTSPANCLTNSQASSNNLTITIHPDPVVNLDKNNSLCDGGARTLDAGNFSSYAWNTGSTNRIIMISNIGLYSVTVTDNNGCTGTDATDITTLLPSPTGFLPRDASICSYGNLLLKPNTGFNSYSWNTGSNSPSIFITQPGKYWLQVKDDNGCIGTDSITVFPKECLKGFFMPTAFTPNNDGKNDNLKPVLLGNVKQYHFWVYNRFGQIVFNSTNPTKGWDGNFKGQNQDGDVFVWICNYQFEGETLQNTKGAVVLIR